MVEVMKTMAMQPLSKDLVFSAPAPAAGHCQLTPPPVTPGHSQSSLGQSLVVSLLLFPGSILGISRLNWAGMDEFNSDDHYIYYCGQESFSRNGIAITVNKTNKVLFVPSKSLFP